jgi:DNA-binding transcriptional LysR family regulator
MDNLDWLILKILNQEKNITRTAEVIYMSQPALTKRLRQIENEFGVEIVRRSKRGIYFTPQGEYLVKCADDFLNMFSRVTDEVKNMEDTIQGTLRIGASYFITRHKLPDILVRFKQQYPKVEFTVITGWSGDIFNLFNNQEFHVAFIRGDYNWNQHKHFLLEETLCIACANKIQLKDLPKIPRIDYKMDHKLKELINNWWWDNFSEPPKIFMEIDKSDTCRELVTKGLGYSILPSLIVENAKDIFLMDIIGKDGLPIKRNTWMFYHQEFLNLKLVNTFVNFVKELNRG